LWQILFEVATELGWESVKASVRRERDVPPLLADIGHFVLGSIAGAVSLLLFGRLFARGPLPGISLLLSPLGTGLAMHVLGEFWRNRGREASGLMTFRGGAIFAFGMALVRFLSLEGWL
jgi:presenilin-like A22 family membrane protease